MSSTTPRRAVGVLALLAGLALAAGCKKDQASPPKDEGEPTELLVEHLNGLSELLEEHVEAPGDGVAPLRAYLHDHLPDAGRQWARLVVELDRLDSVKDRSSRAHELFEVLEAPIERVVKAGAKFVEAAKKDDDAQREVMRVARSYRRMVEEIGEERLVEALGPVWGAATTKYQARGKTTEAIDHLDRIYKSASNYYTAPRVARGTGMKLPCQFPATQGLTPDVRGKACCGGRLDGDGDNRCDVDTTQWTTATWSALNFQMNDQHYFGYAFESTGTLVNAKFTARAHADLDCDGTLSTFERYGYGDASASHAECAMKGSSAFYKDNETE